MIVISKQISRIKYRAGNLIFALRVMKQSLAHKNFMVSAYGPRFFLNEKDATFRFYINGSYGNIYWDHLKDIDFPFVFLDIGANQGLYSIGASLNSNAKHVYAFEPILATYLLLVRNLELNQVKTCTPVRAAISDSSGLGQMHVFAGHSGGARFTLVDQTLQTKEEVVPCLNSDDLNQIVRERRYPILVKIDVEGHEITVVKNLLASDFANLIGEILVEVDEQWIDVSELKESLHQSGFRKTLAIGSGRHYDLLFIRE